MIFWSIYFVCFFFVLIWGSGIAIILKEDDEYQPTLRNIAKELTLGRLLLALLLAIVPVANVIVAFCVLLFYIAWIWHRIYKKGWFEIKIFKDKPTKQELLVEETKERPPCNW